MDLSLLIAGYIVVSGFTAGIVNDYDSLLKMLLFGIFWPFTLPSYIAYSAVTWIKSMPGWMDRYYSYKMAYEEMRHKHSLIEMKRRAEYELEVRFGLVDRD